jgi:glycosyltransferase involved in cell wall biosynthesis
MAQKTPLVSVIMPVYNAEKFLKQAIDSILEQTYTNFELIAINDGSSDGSEKILNEYAKQDKRLKVISQKNQGIVGTLNRGIGEAKGEYIARMDGDDVSFPRRFEQQVAVLLEQKNIVLVAGGFEIIDEENEFLYREVIPAHNRDLKRSMLLRNPIAHGSVMFRKSAIDTVGGYSNSFGPTEDFELWSRLSLVGDFVALENTIFRWRVNSTGITSNNNKLQLEIMKRHIDALWGSSFPKVLSAKQMRAGSRHYFLDYKKRGFDMKRIMLADNASIAIKMIARGHLLMGIHQLAAVAITNRTGIRAAMHRITLTIHGKANSIRKYAKFGRQEV